ncbi:hypothetical protein GobsT_02810 [Gemmata obscuriglobus]|uniref:Peptidase A2 domain-containing protein n=1 Tax=Gemmata obscuriglobus TaxID=114 RepID=A0A2Z3H8A3_9BACT|nr:hypothetical protein [Gemmata obscuriglobus]AWM41111.1 hypothetical protein C1280_31750 [Gemmata obscuriglobus]QEG25554.1 hypothetical protein GobsT_02810 [Gemmata obscuriglobus]VTR98932.1 unnamed protein product [Gemmata obscuriglobus UQM 2246]
MPYVSGALTDGWAIVDVRVAVSDRRRVLLERNGFPVPAPVFVRALLDTGASISGFAPRVFRALDLAPVSTLEVVTPSTPAHAPHASDIYDVSLALVANGSAHPLADMRVMAADCWHADEGLEALLGVDVLSRCFFQLLGPERQFVCAF